MTNRHLQIPLAILAILLFAIFGVAASWFGFTNKIDLPTPSWIWSSSMASDGEMATFTRSFTLENSASSATLHIAADDRAKVWLDGRQVGATVAPLKELEVLIDDLAHGTHTLKIEAANVSGSGAVLAMLNIKSSFVNTLRIVTDSEWETVGSGATNRISATAIAPYGADPWGNVFGKIRTEISQPKDARFWCILLCLVGAITIGSLAGPILRPPSASSRSLIAFNLAVVIPSVVYGSVAVIITALGSYPTISGGLIFAIHVTSTAVFMMLLLGWKEGAKYVERDQVVHRVELKGYDSMLSAVKLLQITLQSMPEEFQKAVGTTTVTLAESIRFASTSSATAQIDVHILNLLHAMASTLVPSHASDKLDSFMSQAQTVSDLLKKREVLAETYRTA